MTKVFIDGSAGTTGLRIYERLGNRSDLSLIILPDEIRKNPDARYEALKESDIAFLCLPDSAAIEAVEMAKGLDTVIIDTSTAHRTNDSWAYGFPEIKNLREKIKASKRIANPGCHASGFIALTEPLVSTGIISKDASLSCFSLTGYSGGGKNMIADYDNPERKDALLAPRMYGISQSHKHLPEMIKLTGINNAPVFCPIVSSYYAGMEVVIPLSKSETKASLNDIKEIYKNYYTGDIVKFCENADDGGFVSAGDFAMRDDMQISVFGNDDRFTLVARYDNLGKGASGAAIQNMNIVLGIDEKSGLNIG
ncbi:MAG: N-acetyl-gamma-glutamyl-phosphate reductase [Clostridia bacterium]|nr:N-acetyl-gamma-glutamyl-phosphate reductase [Clostridia bacterium]